MKAAAAALVFVVAYGLGAVDARAAAREGGDRPNILWITSEDMSPNLGAFGDTYAVTPNLDRLASEGIRYINAFAPIGVCAPSRSSMIMGMYAPSTGTQHMRSNIDLPTRVMLYSQALTQGGYYATNNAKEDYNLRRAPDSAWNESGDKAHWRNRKDSKQPFFAVFNLMASHESQIRLPEAEHQKRTAGFSSRDRHDPALASLPPYHPDVPEVRRDWSRYADMVTLMDKQAGEILKQLAADGLDDNTIAFYYSDHGAGMPRSKRWLYDSSLRVPLIVRFPKRWQHLSPAPIGSIVDRLVSLVDVGPTALSLGGIAIPTTMQGQAFLGATRASSRTYVHGFRDRMDERIDMLRSVRDRRCHYIRNYYPHRIFAQRLEFMFEMPTMKVWQRLWDEGKLIGSQRSFFQEKAPDELYDTWADPHEINNLASNREYRPMLDRLSGEIDRWMLDVHDTGFLPEVELLHRAVGTTPYDLARDPHAYDQRAIMEAADLARRRDPKLLMRLTALLSNQDSAVRFWGATGIAALGRRAAQATTALRLAIKDPSPSVRIAAAEALYGAGMATPALSALALALQDPSESVRLHAVNVIETLGVGARSLIPEIRALRDREPKDSYVSRLLPWLINKFGG